MADSNYTTNVTVSDDSQNQVGVSLNVGSSLYELRVKDKDVYDKLGQGLDASIRNTPWQYWSETGDAFTSPFSATLSTKNTEYDIFLLKNPTGTGIDLHQYKTFLGSAITAVLFMRVYRNPTITTNGTSQTPVNMKSSNGAGVGLAYTIPTISARGTLIRTTIIGSTVGATATSYSNDYDLGLQLEPNENLLITVESSINNTPVYVSHLWAELPAGSL